jgi:hypothetical protein
MQQSLKAKDKMAGLAWAFAIHINEMVTNLKSSYRLLVEE